MCLYLVSFAWGFAHFAPFLYAILSNGSPTVLRIFGGAGGENDGTFLSPRHAVRTAQTQAEMGRNKRPMVPAGRHFKAHPTGLDAKSDSKESKRGSEDGSGLPSSGLFPSLELGIVPLPVFLYY